jgi:transmembrane sensor
MPSLDPRDSRIVQWIRSYRPPTEPRFDTDAAWSRFKHEQGRRVAPRNVLATHQGLWRIAAALVIAVGGAIYWQANRFRGAGTLVERVVANGERATVALDDGSRVTLNGGSRLRYTAGAQTGDRDVYLEGEGFFEVRHDASRAFNVHARRAVVRDVGTQFNVCAYAGSPAVEVVVTDGSVMVARDSSPGPALQLGRGEGATLDTNGVVAKMTSVSAGRSVAWTLGELVFDNVPLRAAALELERRFGVQVSVDSALASRPVAAHFHGETVDQVLDAITVALGARYQHTGSTYMIHSRTR